MRIKINFAYLNELEYRSVYVDHPKASAELLSRCLSLKYMVFGLTVNPEVRGGAVYLKIPAHRGQMRPRRSMMERVARGCERLCARFSEEKDCCDNCGQDHNLVELIEAMINPDCPDPYDPVAAAIPMLVPNRSMPTWTHPRALAGPMVLN